MSSKNFCVSPYLVKRRGFEEFAFNLLVNIIENQDLADGYRHEQDDLTINISSAGKYFLVAVRCYVEDIGWQSTEIEYKKD